MRFSAVRLLNSDKCPWRSCGSGYFFRWLSDDPKGQAGKALTIAAISSFAGGTIGAIFLMGFAPALASFAILFWSAEYFTYAGGSLRCSCLCWKGKVLKALMMTLLGLMLATVGESSLFNAPRFTLGLLDLQARNSFRHSCNGTFAVPEAFFLALDVLRGKREVQGSS